jgi:hypothetical protein
MLDQTANIVFFADGSSSGGTISLSLAHIERTISVQWFSGKVAVGE